MFIILACQIIVDSARSPLTRKSFARGRADATSKLLVEKLAPLFVLTRRSLLDPDELPCVVLWRPEALDCRVLIPPEAWSWLTPYPPSLGIEPRNLPRQRADPYHLSYRCNRASELNIICMSITVTIIIHLTTGSINIIVMCMIVISMCMCVYIYIYRERERMHIYIYIYVHNIIFGRTNCAGTFVPPVLLFIK